MCNRPFVLTIRVVWISCCDKTGPGASHGGAQETVLNWRGWTQVCRREVVRYPECRAERVMVNVVLA
jgi:hypothetical protein